MEITTVGYMLLWKGYNFSEGFTDHELEEIAKCMDAFAKERARELCLPLSKRVAGIAYWAAYDRATNQDDFQTFNDYWYGRGEKEYEELSKWPVHDL